MLPSVQHVKETYSCLITVVWQHALQDILMEQINNVFNAPLGALLVLPVQLAHNVIQDLGIGFKQTRVLCVLQAALLAYQQM